MDGTNTRRAMIVLVVGMLAPLVMATTAGAQGASIDPEAIATFKKMTEYLGGLQRFSLRTENMLEDVFESDQKIQYDFSSDVFIQRPDKLKVQRKGDLVDQVVLYDGDTLAIHNRSQNYYAVTEAPDNIDDMLVFARDTLGLVPPSGDLVFSNAFELLTAPVTEAAVVGKSVVRGVKCDHLAFRSPLVDWQIWIADGDRPLPQKYVLTTRNDPAKPQYIVLMSNWNVSPKWKDSAFTFMAPKGARKTEFLSMDSGQTSGR